MSSVTTFDENRATACIEQMIWQSTCQEPPSNAQQPFFLKSHQQREAHGKPMTICLAKPRKTRSILLSLTTEPVRLAICLVSLQFGLVCLEGFEFPSKSAEQLERKWATCVRKSRTSPVRTAHKIHWGSQVLTSLIFALEWHNRKCGITKWQATRDDKRT